MLLRRRSFAALALVGGLLTSSVASAATAPAVSTITAQVTSATKATKIPSNLTPSLSLFASGSGASQLSGLSYIRPSCDPYSWPAVAAAPVPCIYGDQNGTKTMVLYGDSHAAAWIPTFDAIAKSLHQKLDVFAFAGCATSFVTMTTSGSFADPTHKDSCNTWHSTVAPAVRALRPSTLIVTAGIGYSTYSAANTALWVAGMNKVFAQMTSGLGPVTKIYLGTTPLMPSKVPSCVAIHATTLGSCSLRYSAGSSSYYGNLISRDPLVAKGSGSTLVPMTSLFCANNICPTVVGNTLVYADEDHITTAYALKLVPAVWALLTGAGVR